MPREIAHCHIATSALSQIESFNTLLTNNESLRSSFLLGAISPDSAYYNILLLKNGNKYADLFHGADSHDSFQFIKNILDKDAPTRDQHLNFFFLGVISHILLDSYWHPFIFKVTGDYNHPNAIERTNARARHRRLETVIDQLLLGEIDSNITNFKISKFLAEMESPFLNDTASKLSSLLDANQATIIKTWKWHSNLQNIFISAGGKKIRHSPFIKREIRSLFNSHDPTELMRIKSLVESYNNLKFTKWIEESIEKLSMVFKQYGEDPHKFIVNQIGPSAVTGLIGTLNPTIEYDIENTLLEGY